MLTHCRIAFATAAIALFVSLPTSLMQGQDKDMVELQHYTLTMDKVNHYQHFLMDLHTYGQSHPEAQQAIREAVETDADKHEDTTAIERRMNANPAVSQMLTKNGWTAHEFVLFQAALLQAGMASAMKPANESDPGYAAKIHMNPANLVFLREHKAELEALQSKSGDN